MPFDPRYPPITNSLNRFRLEVGSRTLLPDDIRGQTGYKLVSTMALQTLIEKHLRADAVTAPQQPDDRMTWFYERLDHDADLSGIIAETLGNRLGYLLLTLLQNDDQTRRANPEKDAAYWDYWSKVRAVFLGGGLLSGGFGQRVAEKTHALLHRRGNRADCSVVLADHPQHLPVLGAARIVPAGRRAVVLDFGGTYVKRALANYSDSRLESIQLLDSVPGEFSHRAIQTPKDIRSIFERMVDIITESYRQGSANADTIPVCIAAYVNEKGQPLLSQSGIYMNLANFTGDVPGAFSQAVSDRLGKPVVVRLLHDGTAAALAYSPQPQAAVLTIGTALGSGYPVPRPNLPLRHVRSPLVVK